MEKEKKGFQPKTLLEPFKPGNLLHAIKHPDEVLMKSLKSLTNITGSITGINFNFYSQLRSEAKGKTELTFIGQKKMEKVQLQLFKYNEAEIPELTEMSDYNAIDLSNNLTFIAGVYGMNFENMPELKWRYGYFFIWGVMLTIFIGMIFYFKKKEVALN